MTPSMYALFCHEPYEGDDLIAVSSSIEKLETRKARLLQDAGWPYSGIPEEKPGYHRLRPDNLFIKSVEVL